MPLILIRERYKLQKPDEAISTLGCDEVMTAMQYGEAMITWEGPVKGLDYAPIMVFMMKVANEKYYFVGKETFIDNGNDYHMAVSEFGLRHKSLAGSHSPELQAVFNESEAEQIRNRIVRFFVNKLELNVVYLSQGRCVKVCFSDNWIRLSGRVDRDFVSGQS